MSQDFQIGPIKFHIQDTHLSWSSTVNDVLSIISAPMIVAEYTSFERIISNLLPASENYEEKIGPLNTLNTLNDNL